jgi:hypothetical protein
MCAKRMSQGESLMQEFLPSHVQQAMDEASGEASGEAWAANLAQQAAAWKTARHTRSNIDHAGVLVVRRPVRHPAGRAALRATDRRAL